MAQTDQHEIEVKVGISDLGEFARRLESTGFHLQTPRTHEMNTVFDLPGGALRARGDVLRIRKYGEVWTLTHKSKPITQTLGLHKIRVETETQVGDGDKLAIVLLALGFLVSFRYEKFRTEWTDGTGHVVVDETPIGDVAEIEGTPEWIDSTAHKLGIMSSEYSTKSYAEMFGDWKLRSGHPAAEMTWQAITGDVPK